MGNHGLEKLTNPQVMKIALEEVLRSLGYTEGQAKSVPDRHDLRRSIGPVPDLTWLVREERERS